MELYTFNLLSNANNEALDEFLNIINKYDALVMDVRNKREKNIPKLKMILGNKYLYAGGLSNIWTNGLIKMSNPGPYINLIEKLILDAHKRLCILYQSSNDQKLQCLAIAKMLEKKINLDVNLINFNDDKFCKPERSKSNTIILNKYLQGEKLSFIDWLNDKNESALFGTIRLFFENWIFGARQPKAIIEKIVIGEYKGWHYQLVEDMNAFDYENMIRSNNSYFAQALFWQAWHKYKICVDGDKSDD